MDLDVNMRTGSCPYAVQFYGALFREVGSNCFYDCHCILYYVLFYLSSRAVVNNNFFGCVQFAATVHDRVELCGTPRWKRWILWLAPLRVSQNCPWVAADSLLCANVSSTKLEVHNILHCRMTNYELLRWLAEMPSRDIHHYRMLNHVSGRRFNIFSTVQQSEISNCHVTAILNHNVRLTTVSLPN